MIVGRFHGADGSLSRSDVCPWGTWLRPRGTSSAFVIAELRRCSFIAAIPSLPMVAASCAESIPLCPEPNFRTRSKICPDPKYAARCGFAASPHAEALPDLRAPRPRLLLPAAPARKRTPRLGTSTSPDPGPRWIPLPALRGAGERGRSHRRAHRWGHRRAGEPAGGVRAVQSRAEGLRGKYERRFVFGSWRQILNALGIWDPRACVAGWDVTSGLIGPQVVSASLGAAPRPRSRAAARRRLFSDNRPPDLFQ